MRNINMKINNYKANVSVLSVSVYRKLYAEMSSQFERGELSSAIHKLVMPITDVYLNPDYENDNFLVAKNGYRYSVEMDNWGTTEFANVKSVLAELREMEIPNHQNTNLIWESETNFLAFLKMCCVLRSRALLAHSYRVEQR
jgi:hypothetical protein